MRRDCASWRLVVPVKRLTAAKSRLADGTGEHRAGLALAFAVDTVHAALSCPRVRTVVVVTDDPTVTRAVHDAGALCVPDTGGGLNAALTHGATVLRQRFGAAPTAALSADLPALRPPQLARVLDAAAAHSRAFLADSAGVGTTLLAAAPGVDLAPGFGGASRARHRGSGAVELALPDVPSVRRDVDTAADLREAVRLGVGARTAALIPLLPAA